GARVALRASDGPAALGPVDPLDARIARVEERRALGKVLDDERVLEAGLLEGVVPPERSPSDGRPLRLRDPAVQAIDDRLDRLGERRLRVLLDQPPPNGEELLDRLVPARGVVEVAARDEPDPRIERARREPRLGELDERVVDAQAHRAAVREEARE